MGTSLKAAKVAAIALAAIVVLVAIVVGFFVAVYKLLGVWGVGLTYLGIVFLFLWICAIHDLRKNGGGK